MDKYEGSCSICSEIQGDSSPFRWKGYASLVSSGKNRLATSEAFVLIPSVGALNATHVLLVPNFHVVNVAGLNDAHFVELDEFTRQLARYATRVLKKPLLFFEHGAGTGVDNSGGCVDHAHLHAIASVPNLLSELKKYCHMTQLPDFFAARELADTARGYLLVKDEAGSVWLSNYPGVQSQLLRKLYSQCQGWPEVWNWRIDPRTSEIQNVVEAYNDFEYQGAGDAEQIAAGDV